MNILYKTDVYKLAHVDMYPAKTKKVFSNFTPRKARLAHKDMSAIFVFGVDYVVGRIREELYQLPRTYNDDEVKTYFSKILNTNYNTDKFLELVQYIKKHKSVPLEFKALPEGTLSDFGVPILTVTNTDERFYWLVNYLETHISNLLWPIVTSATIAYFYKKTLTDYYNATCREERDNLSMACSDFSYRGLMGTDASVLVGMGHLAHFKASSTIPAIIEYSQWKNVKNYGRGVISTEHSVMALGKEYISSEEEHIKSLLEKYDSSTFSLVCDTYNIWNVVGRIIPKHANLIKKRKEVITIRPDSGNPFNVIFGLKGSEITKRYSKEDAKLAKKGLLRIIGETFGTKVNEQGYKVIKSKVKIIIGDGVSFDLFKKIISAAKRKRWATSNFIFGLGSNTYQYNTRDTFGFAFKATYAEVGDRKIDIYKDPITSDGFKKSATGLLAVINGKVVEQATPEQMEKSELKVI